MSYFVHEAGICESKQIGSGTRIWAFSHVLPEAIIGKDCNICDNVFIENDVILGNQVTIKCGVQIWDGITIGDNVFIGPNATFTNDLFPRSKQYPESFERTILHNGCSIGANATILPGLSIGKNAMVGAGAVVTRSVPPNSIVIGSPARIVGYVDTKKQANNESPQAAPSKEQETVATRVKGVTLHHLQQVTDLRGSLSAGEFQRQIPFVANRYFIVYDVPSIETRGEHAHFRCHQFLICIKGSVAVVADDGENRQEFILDQPHQAVYLPPMTWGIQYKYSEDAVLLVLASDYYDNEDYIRDYDEYLSQLKSSNT